MKKKLVLGKDYHGWCFRYFSYKQFFGGKEGK